MIVLSVLSPNLNSIADPSLLKEALFRVISGCDSGIVCSGYSS